MGKSGIIALPKGRHFALTWSIPDDFGGMTSALLHRSRAFVRLAGTPVDVLTFDSRPDYPLVEARLRERGALIDGVGLFNLWDWLREHELPSDAPGTLDLDEHVFTPLAPDPEFVCAHRGAVVLSRVRYAADGVTALQVDHYREDGTLLVSDRRDTTERGVLGGRAVVLCDGTGTPVRSWARIWPLYRLWLDLLREREPSFILVDSKTVAPFAMSYQRKRAVIIHVVHNSHLAGNDPLGPLRGSRRQVFEQLPRFDGVVVLTERQRRDIERRFGPVPNLSVIPNGSELRPAVGRDREVGRGIVIASLTGRKRVEHAVRAVIAASERGERNLTLDIFGDGDRRPTIERLVEGRTDIRLHGYRPDARDHLPRASFILLTGSSEGFPLVLVEAMADGCIPIAYDVPYGPSDIIVHGRNGILVPAGDERALAEAVIELQRMPWSRVSRMRRNARRSAAKFSDLEVTRRWAAELRAAAARKARGWAQSGGYPDSRPQHGVAT
jgi:poly(glycerol-phosphate) alpha-glucosyltransferase